MEAFPFFKRSSYAGEIPRVMRRSKGMWRRALRTQDPRVVRKSSARIRSLIRIYKLSGRHNSYRRILRIEREIGRVFRKVKQMRVRTTEPTHTIDAERVIPNDPTAAPKSAFVLRDEF